MTLRRRGVQALLLLLLHEQQTKNGLLEGKDRRNLQHGRAFVQQIQEEGKKGGAFSSIGA